jgi:hypothetical protein
MDRGRAATVFELGKLGGAGPDDLPHAAVMESTAAPTINAAPRKHRARDDFTPAEIDTMFPMYYEWFGL